MSYDWDYVLGENYDLNPDCLDDCYNPNCRCDYIDVEEEDCINFKFYDADCKLWYCLEHSMVFLTIYGKGFTKKLQVEAWGDTDTIHTFYDIENLIENHGSEFEDIFELIDYLEDEYCMFE